MNAEKLRKLKEKQNDLQEMVKEVEDRIDPKEWQTMKMFNTFCAHKLDLTLEFYRRPDGKAAYRFRDSTLEEISKVIKE